MNPDYPLISCICITSNRPQLLQQAITCFEAQNYPNKQLVISYPANDLPTKQLVHQYGSKEDLNILPVERDPDESLGNARNRAIYKCQGAYVCIWDDDDWHHSSRLSFQFNSMKPSGYRYEASILTRIFLYDYTTHLGYLSFPYHWDGTLFCRKETLYQNQYADLNRGEDSQILPFLERKKMLAHIEESPFLYIYTYHGGNTWSYEHFKYFIDKSILLNDKYIAEVRNILQD